jgi:hypothetical protein
MTEGDKDQIIWQARIGAALATRGISLQRIGLAIGAVAFAAGLIVIRTTAGQVATILQLALIALHLYLGFRVGLDADLFRALAHMPNLPAFDHAMRALALIPQEKTGRSMMARIAGLKRLLGWQAVALFAQLLLLFVVMMAGGSAWLR